MTKPALLDINLVPHKHDGQMDLRPDHNLVLNPRDHIIVFAKLDGINRTRMMNQP